MNGMRIPPALLLLTILHALAEPEHPEDVNISGPETFSLPEGTPVVLINVNSETTRTAITKSRREFSRGDVVEIYNCPHCRNTKVILSDPKYPNTMVATLLSALEF